MDRTFGQYTGPYHIHVKASVGSTTKAFATAAAALHIDQRKTGTNVLEQYFESYLPYRWRKSLHPRFKRVTVLDLIQHKVGMVKTGGSERPARERLADGDGAGPRTDDPIAPGENPCNRIPPPVGSSCYTNAAGGMFHFILPYMMSYQLTYNEEQKVKNEPDEPYDARITAFTGQYYNDYVQKFILAPSGVEANCNARAFLGRRPVVAGYASRNDRAGVLHGNNTHNCASGGWVLSVHDLARVLYTLTQTDKILNAESRKRFLGSDNKRVWWWRINVLDGRAHWHNGGIADMSTDMVVFPNGYQMVIATNSKGKDLTKILIRAYNRSRRS
ncbi:MAG: serine hydrolase [Nitrospirota bacterium]|nr:serine hydrolase [Nitrospirota bacterium]